MKNRNVIVGGDVAESTIISGDRNTIIQQLIKGVRRLPTDYATRIENFLVEYLGTRGHPVPFGGRERDLRRLDEWLADVDAPPYLLLAAPAGRGKSALLTRWSQRLLESGGEEMPHVVFMPVSARFRTSLASVTFAALAARLAHLYGDDVPMQMSDSEIWRGMVSNYLSRPLPDGRSLLVILDGVDETADWQLGPDFFPLSPPPSLRVVLSARYQVGDIDAGGWLSRLGWDRPGLAQAPELAPLSPAGVADVLDKIGMPLDYVAQNMELISELHRLSQGDPLLVHLYVEELLSKGAEATRIRPEDLQTIQPGLEGYFDRWWTDQRSLWGEGAPLKELEVQTVLNLLACALGPLLRQDLLILADSELTTWALDEALHPLARFVIGDGEQQGYVFGHHRLAHHFHRHLTQPERTKWEGRFVTWGQRTLAELNSGALSPTQAPSYIVQYYGAHLERSGASVAALATLMEDGWRQAWETLGGTFDAFLNDAARSWRAAEKANTRSVAGGEGATWLGVETRYALCRASVNSLVSRIPAVLLSALVREGIWTPEQGIAYVRQTPEADKRAEALSKLGPDLPKELLRAALEAAQEMEAAEYRASVQARLIPCLAELGNPQSLLPVALEIGAERWRAEALAGLAPHLPERLLRRALKAVQDIESDWWRGKALGQLALALSALGHSLEALAAAREHNAGCWWPEALAGLASHLPEATKEQALRDALAAVEEGESCRRRAEALRKLGPHLPEDLVPKAMAVAREIESEWWQARALAGLVPYMAASVRAREALAEARRIEDAGARAEALVRLAPHLLIALQELVIEEALASAEGIPNVEYRAAVLAELAPHLPARPRERVLEEALESIQKIKDGEHRAEVLARLVPHLVKDLRETVLRQALAAVREIGDTDARGQASVAMILRLAELNHQQEALERIEELHSTQYTAQSLLALVPSLSELRYTREALEAIRDTSSVEHRTEILEALVSRLSELGDVHSALAAAREIRDASARARAVSGLASHLPQELLKDALEAASEIGIAGATAEALTALTPYLPRELLGRALEAIREIRGEQHRTQALTALVPLVPQRLLSKMLEATQEVQNDQYRANALVALSVRLPAELLSEALEVTREIANSGARAEVLSALGVRFPGKLVPEALEAVRKIKNARARAEGLAVLVPYVAEELREQTIQETLTAVRETGGGLQQVEVLAELASHLPDPVYKQALREGLLAVRGNGAELRQAKRFLALIPRLVELGHLKVVFAAAQGIEDVEYRAEALAQLAPQLSEDMLGEALLILQGIESDRYRAELLAALAPHLPETLQEQALREAREIESAEYRGRTLARLAARLAETDYPEKAVIVAREIEDVGSRVQALARLVPRLSEDSSGQLLVETLEAIRKVEGDRYRAEALKSLSACLPHGLLSEALQVVDEIATERYRADALGALAAHLPEELHQTALQQAREIVGDQPRAEALTQLAPHIADELLQQALEAATEIVHAGSRVKALVQLGPRLASLTPLGPAAVTAWQQTLHRSVLRTREGLLADLGALSPFIAALGGKKALTETLQAIQDVGRWWP